MHYGARQQLECIGFVEERIMNASIAHGLSLAEHFKECSEYHHVHERTICRWWNCYMDWGLPPFEVKEVLKRYKRKKRMYKRTTIVTDDIVESLRDIVDSNPEYYLDEIAEELLSRTGKYLSVPTIYRTLTHKLQYSLQVCYESALQRDEAHRIMMH